MSQSAVGDKREPGEMIPWVRNLMWLWLAVGIASVVLTNRYYAGQLFPEWLWLVLMVGTLLPALVLAGNVALRSIYQNRVESDQHWQASLDQQLVAAKVATIRRKLAGLPSKERREVLRRLRESG